MTRYVEEITSKLHMDRYQHPLSWFGRSENDTEPRTCEKHVPVAVSYLVHVNARRIQLHAKAATTIFGGLACASSCGSATVQPSRRGEQEHTYGVSQNPETNARLFP
jgi:hypothetical protein